MYGETVNEIPIKNFCTWHTWKYVGFFRQKTNFFQDSQENRSVPVCNDEATLALLAVMPLGSIGFTVILA